MPRYRPGSHGAARGGNVLFSRQQSSPLIELEHLPTSPYHVASDRGRESTLPIHDASLEMENSWAMEIYKAPTMASDRKDLIDKRGSFTLDLPREPCLHLVSPSQPRSVHRAHIRTTIAVWSSHVKSLEGLGLV
jgi:hypothetical protein